MIILFFSKINVKMCECLEIRLPQNLTCIHECTLFDVQFNFLLYAIPMIILDNYITISIIIIIISTWCHG